MSAPDEAIDEAIEHLLVALASAGFDKSAQLHVLVSTAEDATVVDTFLGQFPKVCMSGSATKQEREALPLYENLVEAWSTVVGLCDGFEGTTAFFAKRYGKKR